MGAESGGTGGRVPDGQTSVIGGAICSSGGEIAPPVNMLSEALLSNDLGITHHHQLALQTGADVTDVTDMIFVLIIHTMWRCQ